MQYIQRDKLVHIEWSIFRGTSQVPEDFSRALVKMFLIGGNEKYLLTATAEGGKLLADLPGDLPEGAYSLEAIWVKNYGNLLPHRQPLTPGGEPVCPRRPGPHPNDPCFIHPHDNRFNDRCLMRSRKDYVFALTDYPSEETVTGESGEVTVRLASSVATYGYDGLSAYQIAVMRGDFSGTEGEFLAQSGFTKLKTINGESLIGEGDIQITGGGTLETATETKLGGIRAATKTSLETQEVKIDPSTGKLYTQPGGEGGVEIVNNPDEEDLHSIEKSTDVHVLQFADKEYNASAFSGLGRVYLRKNISSNKNILTQAMMSKANTRYIIQYDYDLDGETITVPEGCTLDFEGGSLKNGSLCGNETVIKSEDNAILYDINLLGSFIGVFNSAWIGGDSINYGETLSNVFSHYEEIHISHDIHITSPIFIPGEYVLDIGYNKIFVDADINAINIANIPTVKNGIIKITVSNYSHRVISIVSNGDGIFKASLCLSNIKIEGSNTMNDSERYGNYGIVLEALPVGNTDGFIAFRTFENISISGLETGLYLKCGKGDGKPKTPYINSNIFNNINFNGTFNCLVAEVIKESSISNDPGGEICANVFNGFTVQAWGAKQESIIKFVGQVARNIITHCYIWDLFDNSNPLLQLDQWSVNNYIRSNIFDNSVKSINIQETGHDNVSYANNIRRYDFPEDINPTFLGDLNLSPIGSYGLAPDSSQRKRGLGAVYNSDSDSNDMCIYPHGIGRSGFKFFTYTDYTGNTAKESFEIRYDGVILPKNYVFFRSKPFVAFEKGNSYSPLYNGEVYFSKEFKCLTTNYNGDEYLQDGYRAIARKGDSNSRPTLYDVDTGFMYFDTTLNKPIYWTGSKWVDAMGIDL